MVRNSKIMNSEWFNKFDPFSFKCNLWIQRNNTPNLEYIEVLACSAGVFFGRAICSRNRHVETSRREEEMGYYLIYSPQSSTVIKSKMAATTYYEHEQGFSDLKYACTAG